MAYVAVVVGVLIAAAVVDQADAGGLGAKQAWLYVTILTVGYMVDRGLAKSGTPQPYERTAPSWSCAAAHRAGGAASRYPQDPISRRPTT